MDALNRGSLVFQSRSRLEGKDSRKLAMIHAGITAAVMLVITLLQQALFLGIGQTGGLSGMGTRSMLQTIQTVLQWANMLLVPFWNLGFLFAALCWTRDQYARPGDLLKGFHRFGPYLRLMLIKGALIFLVVVLTSNVSSMFYMLTPQAMELMALIESVNMDMNALNQLLAEMTQGQMAALIRTMLPMLIIWAALSIALLIPVFYRMRMAEWVILDHPGIGAVAAIFLSFKLTRRRCLWLFRLDLKFWWYYGLQLLCQVLLYADVLLTLLGVQLPIGSGAMYLLTVGMYLVSYFAVMTAFRPLVETTYAGAYDGFVKLSQEETPGKPVRQPIKLPWDEPRG